MSDKQSAALLIAIGAVSFIVWYRGRPEEQRVSLFGGANTAPGGGPTPGNIPLGEKGRRHLNAPREAIKSGAGLFKGIEGFAERHGLNKPRAPWPRTPGVPHAPWTDYPGGYTAWVKKHGYASK